LYLDDKEAVGRFIASIANTRAIALDTEGASFHRFIDRIYLLQLSTRDASAILDPLTIDVPEGLGALVESRTSSTRALRLSSLEFGRSDWPHSWSDSLA